MSQDKDLTAGIVNILRKAVSTGIGAAFMTEESVKKMLADLPLPKDIANGLLQNAKNTKDEFVDSIKNELRSYLANVDLSKEIENIVKNYDFEISAKIKLAPKDKKQTSPKLKVSKKPKR